MNQGEPKLPIAIVKPIRRSIPLLAIRMFLILFLVDTAYAFLMLVPLLGYIATAWNIPYIAFLLVAYTVLNVPLIYLLIVLVTRWISTLYYVSDTHLIQQRGILDIQETVYQLSDIESVTMSQSWLGRFLNFGDVTIIIVFAMQRVNIVLYAINNPGMYEKLFAEFV